MYVVEIENRSLEWLAMSSSLNRWLANGGKDGIEESRRYGKAIEMSDVHALTGTPASEGGMDGLESSAGSDEAERS